MHSRLGFALLLVVFAAAQEVMSQNKPCDFNQETLQFIGRPIEQARCLLRPNGRGGVLLSPLAKLPKPLEKLVGQKVKIRAERLRTYLAKTGIAANDIGGDPDKPLSTGILGDGTKIAAVYFIIHDTSSPYLKDAPFPANFDTDPNWRGNLLSVWTNNPVAHVFVNRLGESLTTTPFDETVRKGWGTKFARDFLKAPGKGLQLHIELIQPRRRDPNSPNQENDLIAPAPGFTAKQYDRLALLYVAASVRRGTWLIPAYHSAIDAGIKDAHDDPQNFELAAFAAALKQLINELK